MPDAAAAPQQIGELERLARERFTDPKLPLTPSEVSLLQAAPNGAFAACAPADAENEKDRPNPANDVSKAHTDAWSPDRKIRADLIRWLCVDRRAKDLVDPKGLRVSGAVIPDPLDLSFVTVPFPLTLERCRLLEASDMRAIDIPAINLEGTQVRSIDAESAKVKSSVELCNGFVSEGMVSLQGAEIDGELNCNRSKFGRPPADGVARAFALRADYAVVKCGVSMADQFVAEGEVGLRSAQIGGPLICANAIFRNPFRMSVAEDKTVSFVGDTGQALMADGIAVKGTVFLTYSRFEGEVSLRGAQLGGTLDCSGGAFINPRPVPAKDTISEPIDSTNAALSADGAVIGNSVFLRSGFQAEGEVRFMGAQIGSNLECIGGSFTNSPQTWAKENTTPVVDGTGTALNVDAAVVKGNMFLSRKFSAEGEVRLMGTQIAGVLECIDAAFKNPLVPNNSLSGNALTADSMITSGYVSLTSGFDADGAVSLRNAQIGGDLDCTGAKLSADLIAESAVIKGNFVWSGIPQSETIRVSMVNTSAGGLMGDVKSWAGAAAGKQQLDGFVYGHVKDLTNNLEGRLDWLRSQDSFTSQPYLQLAKVLSDEGEDAAARHVLYSMEIERRKKEKRPSAPSWKISNFKQGVSYLLYPLRLVWNFTLRMTIGYGYYTDWCLRWLLLVIVSGWLIFYVGYYAGNVVPTNETAYATFKTSGAAPAYYGRFHAFIYSLENSFPLVKLGQADLWQPDPNSSATPPASRQSRRVPKLFFESAKFLASFRWFQILAGWFLATMGVTGLSGVIRKD
jgi:hypothetical protein